MVLCGLILIHKGWPLADTLATLALAAFLTWTSWSIGQRAAAILLDIADPASSLDALETLESHPAVESVPVLRLHRRLRGSDVVARVVIGPEAAPCAARAAAELERQILEHDGISARSSSSRSRDDRRRRFRMREEAPHDSVDP